jgi:ring-1,2-phenylacetyl-CoA epoxidase subunit PaaC
VQRLGDGTPQSHAKVQAALNALWPYCTEWFADDVVTHHSHAAGIAPLNASIQPRWDDIVNALFAQSGLKRPATTAFTSQGSQGLHSEHLGYLLAEMQSVARAHPGASW